MENNPPKPILKKTAEEKADEIAAAARARLDEDPRLKRGFRQYSEEFSKVLEGPMTPYDDWDDSFSDDDQEDLSNEASCSPSKESCWDFDCDKVPLETRRPVPHERTSMEERAGIYAADSIAAAFGQTPSHTYTGSEVVEFLEGQGLKKNSNVEEVIPVPLSDDFVHEESTYITSGPTPIRIPHAEIVNAMNGFANMFLAHEIAINDNFEMESLMPPQDSLEARVRIQMRKAFWDKFDVTFKEKNYMHALLILREIKEEMLSILLPHQKNLRAQIDDVLDLVLIERQIDMQVFEPQDFRRYANYIIYTLGKLCCPVRDPDVKALRESNSGSGVFRGILELIEKMKLDMAKFVLSHTRGLIIKQCVHYERTKFADFLELEYRIGHDGLKFTRLWLMRHKEEKEKRETRLVVAKAFGELLNYNLENGWPEILTLDTARLHDMELNLRRLAIIGTCILAVNVTYQVKFGDHFVHELRERSKKHLKLILTTADMKDSKKTTEAIHRIAEEMCSFVNQLVGTNLGRDITEAEKMAIRKCVLEVNEPNHKIHSLMLKRIYEFVGEVVRARWAYPVAMPPGLAIIHYEIYGTMSQFYRLIQHTRRVYGPILHGLVKGDILPPVYTSNEKETWDPKFCEMLKLLRKDFVEDEKDGEARRQDHIRVRHARSRLPDGIP